MIINKGTLSVTNGILHISDWLGLSCDTELSQLFLNGRVIVNKIATGCGFTSWCLWNPYNVILISPRIRLIQNKMEQKNPSGYSYYYFDRERGRKRKKSKSLDQLETEFTAYYQENVELGKPFKIFVTYDSFGKLTDMLEQKFGLDLNQFRLVIDESHSLIKDVKLKENSIEPVLPRFLERLFQYYNLLFISATPIINYIQGIPEFIKNEVWYYELEWSNTDVITPRKRSIRNSLSAFDEIYDRWSKTTDPDGNRVFDRLYQGNQSFYSYEAVIFLNSIKDICGILRKYIKKEQKIQISDVTIICQQGVENSSKLSKAVPGLEIAESIPLNGQPHTTWTFVTRTAFEGVDFYSPTASTYIITNYNVSSLCIDIASDVPQIIGRQRRLDNPFRCVVNIYFTNNTGYDDSEYQKMQEEKERDSYNQLTIWSAVNGSARETALSNLQKVIQFDPNANYIRIIDGIPQYTEILKIAEDYSRDILVNHQSWFVLKDPAGMIEYSDRIRQLLRHLREPIDTSRRIQYICQYFMESKDESEAKEVYELLFREEFSGLAYYFSNLSLDRIIANGYNTTRMNQEISQRNSQVAIVQSIKNRFSQGVEYSGKEVKNMLQEIYNSFGLKATAKATDLLEYFPDCKKKKIHGSYYYVLP